MVDIFTRTHPPLPPKNEQCRCVTAKIAGLVGQFFHKKKLA